MPTGPIKITPPASSGLARRARVQLQQIARRAVPITYKALADALELTPPNTIHQITEALEQLMKEDRANGHPFIAALVISRMRGGLPAPGFFQAAQGFGCFAGDPSGPEAAAFHEAAFIAAVDFWGSAQIPGPDNTA
jgi:hypothetical protein